jgi:hypothetical protein
MAEQSGASAHQQQLVLDVLGLLDPACQEKLETFSVQYNDPAHRGLAGRGVIIVSGSVADAEFIGLLLHEGLGHFRDLTCVNGNERSGKSAFTDGGDPIWSDDPSVYFYGISWANEKKRKTDAVPADFVTGYAYQADNFEDLAESVTYYITQEDAFRERAKTNTALAKKLSWLETYMPKGKRLADGDTWNGRIPWDATKLAFEWTNN